MNEPIYECFVVCYSKSSYIYVLSHGNASVESGFSINKNLPDGAKLGRKVSHSTKTNVWYHQNTCTWWSSESTGTHHEGSGKVCNLLPNVIEPHLRQKRTQNAIVILLTKGKLMRRWSWRICLSWASLYNSTHENRNVRFWVKWSHWKKLLSDTALQIHMKVTKRNWYFQSQTIFHHAITYRGFCSVWNVHHSTNMNKQITLVYT